MWLEHDRLDTVGCDWNMTDRLRRAVVGTGVYPLPLLRPIVRKPLKEKGGMVGMGKIDNEQRVKININTIV